MQFRSWHDYLALIFYVIGFVILAKAALSLGTFLDGFAVLPAEMQLAISENLFLQFWSGITQFAIGWLVARAKPDTGSEQREVSESKKVRVPKSISTIIRAALIIVTIFVAILLVFTFIQYVHANPSPFHTII